MFDYTLDNILLGRISVIKDLGVMFDSRLTFQNHVDKIYNSGYAVLGFIKRRAKEFDDPYITKTLYTSLVQSILEYGTITWAPHQLKISDRIDSIQKQFLLFAMRQLD